MAVNTQPKKTDYSTYTSKELIQEIHKLNKQKHGLVWEDKPEQVAEQCKQKFPTLSEIKSKEIHNNEDSSNILIEGDNYHSLSVLNYTHKGKIDAIYIDPPYNTGAKDWKYNNDFVDSEDSYKHSKWLSFMSKRLKLAKKLLRKDGVICCTIDDNELPNLLLIMDEIFDHQHLGTVIIRNNPSGRTTTKRISLVHEYAIFYGASKESRIYPVDVSIIDKSHKYKIDHDGLYYTERNLRHVATHESRKKSSRFYPIYFDITTGEISISKKLKQMILPIDNTNTERVWSKSKEDVEKLYDKGDIWIKKIKANYQIFYKQKRDHIKEPIKSIWSDSRFSAREHGTGVINDIFGTVGNFTFPKSLFAVIECVKTSNSKKDAVILDFFAGSGTTGQAVLELNKDGGNRKFILCTNNENDICTDICYPRIKKVIEGYVNSKGKKIEGLGGNLKYFKTSFMDSKD